MTDYFSNLIQLSGIKINSQTGWQSSDNPVPHYPDQGVIPEKAQNNTLPWERHQQVEVAQTEVAADDQNQELPQSDEGKSTHIPDPKAEPKNPPKSFKSYKGDTVPTSQFVSEKIDTPLISLKQEKALDINQKYSKTKVAREITENIAAQKAKPDIIIEKVITTESKQPEKKSSPLIEKDIQSSKQPVQAAKPGIPQDQPVVLKTNHEKLNQKTIFQKVQAWVAEDSGTKDGFEPTLYSEVTRIKEKITYETKKPFMHIARPIPEGPESSSKKSLPQDLTLTIGNINITVEESQKIKPETEIRPQVPPVNKRDKSFLKWQRNYIRVR